jgi:hypothetical protein
MELLAGVSTSTYTYAGTGYANPQCVTQDIPICPENIFAARIIIEACSTCPIASAALPP